MCDFSKIQIVVENSLQAKFLRKEFGIDTFIGINRFDENNKLLGHIDLEWMDVGKLRRYHPEIAGFYDNVKNFDDVLGNKFKAWKKRNGY